MGVHESTFSGIYILIGNDIGGLLPPADKEAEKADTWCPKSHSLELSEDISYSKIHVVAQVITSDFEACPILDELLYVTGTNYFLEMCDQFCS